MVPCCNISSRDAVYIPDAHIISWISLLLRELEIKSMITTPKKLES
jgi:hypothetical protein